MATRTVVQRLGGLFVLVTLILSGCSSALPRAEETQDAADTVTREGKEVLTVDDTGQEAKKVYVTVQVSADVARVLYGQASPTADSRELMEITQELGVALEPLHPGVEDLSLARYFVIEVADPAAAEQVIARLQGSNAVEAAYLQPPGEPPAEIP